MEEEVKIEEKAEEQIVTEQIDPAVEQRARMMGWVDKDQFRGDPGKWRPATEFVSRADEMMPILKAQNKRYEDKIYSLESEIKNQKVAIERILKVSDRVQQREYERARAEIIKQQAEAVGSGDMARWQNLELEKEKLEKPEKVAVEPTQPQQTPENNPSFQQWHRDNDWYLSDQDLTLYANAWASANQNSAIPYNTWLDNVKEAVKKAFPHKFSNPNRMKAASVDTGMQSGVGPGRPKNKTYNDLPSDAKIVCDRFVAQKLFKSREDYVKEYFSEE